MKKIRYAVMVMVLMTTLEVRAQGTDDLAVLRQQLEELSAKVARLEQVSADKIAQMEQANADKIAQIEAANAAKIAQIEQASAERIAQIEQANGVTLAKVEQLSSNQTAQVHSEYAEKLAKIEADAAKNKLPDWVKNTQFKGDFRYRYEQVHVDNNEKEDKDRQRVRLRVGAYGKVNDFTDYGVRVATGGASATSSNTDIDGSTKKEIMWDMYYADLHPEWMKGSHLFMGKMPQPWLDRTGLIWDSDLNPEGVALTYASSNTNGLKVMANTGTFVVDEQGADDLQLWSGQVAGEHKIGKATLRVGASDYYYYNADQYGSVAGLTTSANTPGTEFNLVEGFSTLSFTLGIPVALNGQYVVNTDAATSEDTAYLFGTTLGKAKDKGSWEAGYNYRDTEKDAVPDGYNDSDFAHGVAGSKGHSFWTKYQLAKNLQACATYLLAKDNKDEDSDLIQLDLNFKF